MKIKLLLNTSTCLEQYLAPARHSVSPRERGSVHRNKLCVGDPGSSASTGAATVSLPRVRGDCCSFVTAGRGAPCTPGLPGHDSRPLLLQPHPSGLWVSSGQNSGLKWSDNITGQVSTRQGFRLFRPSLSAFLLIKGSLLAQVSGAAARRN